jgi:hypothetical protein
VLQDERPAAGAGVSGAGAVGEQEYVGEGGLGHRGERVGGEGGWVLI